MKGSIVYEPPPPQQEHPCRPPKGNWRKGAIWRCECGRHWLWGCRPPDENVMPDTLHWCWWAYPIGFTPTPPPPPKPPAGLEEAWEARCIEAGRQAGASEVEIPAVSLMFEGGYVAGDLAGWKEGFSGVEDQIKALRDLLRQVEWPWSERAKAGRCLFCFNIERDGHKSGCPLAILLKEPKP